MKSEAYTIELPQCMLRYQPSIIVQKRIRADRVNGNDLRQRMRTQLFLSAIRIETCLLVLTIVRFQRLFDPHVCVEAQ